MRPIAVMGLLSLDHTGHLANLSTVTGDGAIRGDPGGDELWGGNGDDVIDPSDNSTSNNLDVDSGFDIVNGSRGNDRIVYTLGRARDDGYGSVDTFTGDIPKGIAGSEFSDVIRGSDRNEWFFGRRGNDDIDAGGGSDMLQLGYSSRFAAYTAGVQNLVIDLDAGTATGTWDGSAFSYRISNFEHGLRGVRASDLREILRREGGDSGAGSLGCIRVVFFH